MGGKSEGLSQEGWGGFQEDEIGKEWNIPERRNHISSSILKSLGLA